MRVVLDTNILVSASAYTGNEWRLLNQAFDGDFDLYVSPFIFGELRRVLARPNFEWSLERIDRTVRRIEGAAFFIDPSPLLSSPTGHAPDDRILACVAAANADLLVTGDRRHLPPLRSFANARIVTAAEFLEELERANS